MQKVTKKLKSYKLQAFSLIEVLIGLGIVLITLTILGVVINTVPLTKNARYQSTAYHIAAKEVEILRNTSFASLPGSGSFSGTGLSSLPSGSGSLTVVNYQSSTDIKQITVTVSWNDRGTTRSVTLETLIGSGGLSQ